MDEKPSSRVRAIELLLKRGFEHIGEDPVGLPCFRSPSGALLIGVGSCRSIAYTKVKGKLQIAAAARTDALVCRIISPEAAPPPAAKADLTPARAVAVASSARTAVPPAAYTAAYTAAYKAAFAAASAAASAAVSAAAATAAVAAATAPIPSQTPAPVSAPWPTPANVTSLPRARKTA